MTSTMPAVWVPQNIRANRPEKAKRTPSKSRVTYDTMKLGMRNLYKVANALILVALSCAGYSLQQTQLNITKLQEAARYIDGYEANGGIRDQWEVLQSGFEKIYEKQSHDTIAYDREVLARLGMVVDGQGVVTALEATDERIAVNSVARHFRNVVRCVEDERCSNESIKAYYDRDMCSFRSYMYPYIALLTAHENSNGEAESIGVRHSIHTPVWKLQDTSRLWRSEYGNFYKFTRTCSTAS